MPNTSCRGRGAATVSTGRRPWNAFQSNARFARRLKNSRPLGKFRRSKNKPASNQKVRGRGGSKMSVAILGSLIVWLIVAVVVIAIVVYFVNWLYYRSSKEVSFVRTGLFGEKVVINSGAFVLPFIHEITPVNMNVLRMQVVRNRDNALITKDRMRVDIESEFYVRVPPTREAVTIAAATLGRRTMNVAELDALLSGKLVSA